ncbi:MAG: hypothetical protein AB7O32_15415 [Vicinamibacterales bacterium]
MPDGTNWTTLIVGAALAIALFAMLLGPFLKREILEGKRNRGPLRRHRPGGVELGPPTPPGAGDVNPGRVGDPAPGDPSGQADPYSPQAQRGAPPIKS